jgi:hypothetical protein
MPTHNWSAAARVALGCGHIVGNGVRATYATRTALGTILLVQRVALFFLPVQPESTIDPRSLAQDGFSLRTGRSISEHQPLTHA